MKVLSTWAALASFLFLIGTGWCAPKKNADVGGILLRAEDALELLNYTPTPESKERLLKLISMRRSLLAGVKDEKVVKRSTLFGDAMGDIGDAESWFRREDREVRALLPRDRIRDAEKLSTEMSEQADNVSRYFPVTSDWKWNLSQEISGTAEGSTLVLKTSLDVPSPLFIIVKDTAEIQGDSCILRFTLMRPSNRALVGKKAVPTTLSYQVVFSNNAAHLRTVLDAMPDQEKKQADVKLLPVLPKSYVIFVRTITLDRPSLIDYAQMGTMPLPPLEIKAVGSAQN